MRTVAGGLILDPFLEPRRRIKNLQAYGAARDTADSEQRLSQFLAECDVVEPAPLEAAWRCGIPVSRYAELDSRRVPEAWRLAPDFSRRHSRVCASAAFRNVDRGRVAKDYRGDRAGISHVAQCPRKSCGPPALQSPEADVLDAALGQLVQSGQLVQVGANLGLADGRVTHQPRAVARPPTLAPATGPRGTADCGRRPFATPSASQSASLRSSETRWRCPSPAAPPLLPAPPVRPQRGA